LQKIIEESLKLRSEIKVSKLFEGEIVKDFLEERTVDQERKDE